MEIYAIDKKTGHKWTLEELIKPIDYEELSFLDYILSGQSEISVGIWYIFNDDMPEWSKKHLDDNEYIKYNQDDIELYIDGKLWKKH